MADRLCLWCKYMNTFGDEELVECRRHAPRARHFPESAPEDMLSYKMVIWPVVNKEDWCGEFVKDDEE